MANAKQTATWSTGGKALRKQLATKAARRAKPKWGSNLLEEDPELPSTSRTFEWAMWDARQHRRLPYAQKLGGCSVAYLDVIVFDSWFA